MMIPSFWLLSIIQLALAIDPFIVGFGGSSIAGRGLKMPVGDIIRDILSLRTGTTYDFINMATHGHSLKLVIRRQMRDPYFLEHKPALVYIMAGGEDMHYEACLREPYQGLCDHPISENEFKIRYKEMLDTVIERVLDYSNTTRVYVLTYPTAISKHETLGHPYAEFVFDRHKFLVVQELHRKLNTYIYEAVEEWKAAGGRTAKIVLSDFETLSKDHAADCDDPWINGPSGKIDGGAGWLPNTPGAEAIAQTILWEFLNITTSRGLKESSSECPWDDRLDGNCKFI